MVAKYDIYSGSGREQAQTLMCQILELCTSAQESGGIASVTVLESLLGAFLNAASDMGFEPREVEENLIEQANLVPEIFAQLRRPH